MRQLSETLDLPTQELYLLGFLVAVSAAMLAASFTYGRTAALFPQLTAGIVIVGAVLIAIHRWLPPAVQSIVTGEGAAFEREEFAEAEEALDDRLAAADEARERGVIGWREDTVVTAILFAGYVVGGYLVGLLWATPAFVYAYARWFDQPRWVRWTLVVVSILLAVVFQVFLRLNLVTGLLHDLVGIA